MAGPYEAGGLLGAFFAGPLEQTGGIGVLGFGIGVITWLGLGAGTYE